MMMPHAATKSIPSNPEVGGELNFTSRQDEINRSVYSSRKVYRYYLSPDLTLSETACLLKYQPQIAGRDVLDIGVGAGRTIPHLAPLARRYAAVDYSQVMVDYVKRTLPEIDVRQADFRDLRMFEDASFDFILATDNVIDALSHPDRLRALSEAWRVLRPGGLLAFSSHNLRYKHAFSRPQLKYFSHPLRFARSLAKYLVSWRNHLRVAPFRKVTSEYALINDPGHHYACLHYYASLSTVETQLAAQGMRLIEVFDKAGQPVTQGQDVSENPSLLYVAERVIPTA